MADVAAVARASEATSGVTTSPFIGDAGGAMSTDDIMGPMVGRYRGIPSGCKHPSVANRTSVWVRLKGLRNDL